MTPQERFSLTIPATPEQVATARLFVATIARILDVDEEVVDDLKLAVSELVSPAAAVRTGDIEVTAVAGVDRLRVTVTPSVPGEDGLAMDIVRSLFPDGVREGQPVVIVVPLTRPVP